MESGSDSQASSSDGGTPTASLPERESTSMEPEEEESDDETDQCRSNCCTSGKPNQPTSTLILATTKRTQSGQAEYVQSSWFSQYPWLTLCERRKKLFCTYCMTAENRKLITFSTKADKAFSKNGFNNWKKASQSFTKHEASKAHSEAYDKLCYPVDIGPMMCGAHKKDQENRRQMLFKQLSSLRYLLR